MKFAAAIAAFTLSTTSAFAPAFVGKHTTALNGYENEIGAIPPVGYFDPLGLSENVDQDRFDFLRTGEVKNGRAAMLAVIGYVVPEFYRFPGELYPGLAFKDIPNGVQAIKVIPGEFWIATFFAIGFVDYTFSDRVNARHEIAPGPPLDDETMAIRRANEVSNGRLAMLAFWELVRHDISRGVDGLSDNMITGFPFLYDN
jgi:hypothetical protein